MFPQRFKTRRERKSRFDSNPHLHYLYRCPSGPAPPTSFKSDMLDENKEKTLTLDHCPHPHTHTIYLGGLVGVLPPSSFKSDMPCKNKVKPPLLVHSLSLSLPP